MSLAFSLDLRMSLPSLPGRAIAPKRVKSFNSRASSATKGNKGGLLERLKKRRHGKRYDVGEEYYDDDESIESLDFTRKFSPPSRIDVPVDDVRDDEPSLGNDFTRDLIEQVSRMAAPPTTPPQPLPPPPPPVVIEPEPVPHAPVVFAIPPSPDPTEKADNDGDTVYTMKKEKKKENKLRKQRKEKDKEKEEEKEEEYSLVHESPLLYVEATEVAALCKGVFCRDCSGVTDWCTGIIFPVDATGQASLGEGSSKIRGVSRHSIASTSGSHSEKELQRRMNEFPLREEDEFSHDIPRSVSKNNGGKGIPGELSRSESREMTSLLDKKTRKKKKKKKKKNVMNSVASVTSSLTSGRKGQADVASPRDDASMLNRLRGEIANGAEQTFARRDGGGESAMHRDDMIAYGLGSPTMVDNVRDGPAIESSPTMTYREFSGDDYGESNDILDGMILGTSPTMNDPFAGGGYDGVVYDGWDGSRQFVDYGDGQNGRYIFGDLEEC
ncbi:hypothetical protein ACHAWF_017348 [Thalassiosira exigua]